MKKKRIFRFAAKLWKQYYFSFQKDHIYNKTLNKALRISFYILLLFNLKETFSSGHTLICHNIVFRSDILFHPLKACKQKYTVSLLWLKHSHLNRTHKWKTNTFEKSQTDLKNMT